MDLAHPQQHPCQGCPFLCTACALVGFGANREEGWKPASRCGDGRSSLLQGSLAAADPLQRSSCFTRARMRQIISPLVYLLCAHDKARVRSLPLKLWSSCSALEFFKLLFWWQSPNNKRLKHCGAESNGRLPVAEAPLTASHHFSHFGKTS